MFRYLDITITFRDVTLITAPDIDLGRQVGAFSDDVAAACGQRLRSLHTNRAWILLPVTVFPFPCYRS
jgi:hypothetical protein